MNRYTLLRLHSPMKHSSLTQTSPERGGTRILASLAHFSLLAALTVVGPLQAAEDKVGAEKFFNQYCTACHGEAAQTAGISLSELMGQESVAEGFHDWEKVIAAIRDKRMPPKMMPQPSDDDRAAAISWIHHSLQEYAKENDGDPGRVTVRRLTSGEYSYTIQDLTGLEIDFERDFVPDAVGGEGFTNYGDAQFTADAELELYLEAAKRVADHAVIGAGPLSFYGDPGMSGFELSAIHRVHDIYREHGFRAVAAEGGRAFGLERYSKAFFAAWQYKNRAALGEPNKTLNEFGKDHDLSPRFVEHIWNVLDQRGHSYPTTEVVSQWRALPAPDGSNEAAVMAKAEELQEFVINWPRWLFGAGELAAGGAGDERALVITDASLQAKMSEELTFVQRMERKDGDTATVYISVGSANPGASTNASVIFREASVRLTREAASTPVRELLDAETIERLAFGRGPNGTLIGPDDFVVGAGENVSFIAKVPTGTRAFGMRVGAEITGDPGDAVLRVLISENEEGNSGRPAWALLGDSDSQGFKDWKADVIEYAGYFPQTSHGEPTPSDRDPIPPPFNNDYNQNERNQYHQRVKYYRDDAFIVDKMLDDKTRRELDVAWADVKASFEFHDQTLEQLEAKYGVEFENKAGELTDADIASLPAEAQPFVRALRSDYREVMATQKMAQPAHLEDALAFAERAWRRPLTESEKDSLRGFYVKAGEELELDHRKAVRALITRILVAPSFLYRLEEPEAPKGVTELNSFELANRISYFLWSSAPDQELLDLAKTGKLDDEKVLRAQVQRMLDDPKARRLATEFFGQWLGFYRFDQYRGVDTKRFPEFTEEVKASMYDEAVSFFEHIIREDRPVREIVSADYAFLNKSLAKIYNLDAEIESDEITLVENADKLNRGGVLRMGAVLTATSAPLRTSPVKRGDWVLRRIVGTPVPPPPPNVPEIEADDKGFGATTVFEQMEAHKTNPTCAGCHNRIDPLGFPLEHFDSIGRWRTEYSNGQPIHDSGTLVDNTEINGLDGLMDYLHTQEPQVLKNMSYKLLGFALGRTVQASDQLLVERLTQGGGEQTFADLATAIVTSQQFQTRLGRDEAPATSQTADEAPATALAGEGGR